MNGNDLMRAMSHIDEKFLTESNNYISVSAKRKKISLKAALTATIAVAVISVPVGALAYNAFVHRETVSKYISNVEILEQNSPETVKNIVLENNDYRITVDSIISDGNTAIMILTHEPLTDKGLQIRERINGYVGACITYADGSEGPFESEGIKGVPMTGPICCFSIGNESEFNGYDKTFCIFSCKDIDLNKEINIELYSSENGFSSALEYFVNRDNPKYNRYESLSNDLNGMVFTTSFAKNTECVQLKSDDGKCVSMSSFEVYSEDPAIFSSFEDELYENSFYITNSGDKIPFEKNKCSFGARTNFGFVSFGEYIDITEYKGVVINGIEYLK